MSRPHVDDVFRAVADPTRRQILRALADGERPVMALAGQFGITAPALSQHLKALREVDLVRVRRVGRERWYQLHARPLKQVRDFVNHFERFWGRKLDALDDYLRRNG